MKRQNKERNRPELSFINTITLDYLTKKGLFSEKKYKEQTPFVSSVCRRIHFGKSAQRMAVG